MEAQSPNMVAQADQLLAALEISDWKQRGRPLSQLSVASS